MKYVTKKKEVVKQKPKPDPLRKVANELSGLLVTAIKQNQEITKVHAAQITRAITDISQLNAKAPVVTVQQAGNRTIHMDVNRGSNGFIESVDGTIEG